MSKIMDDMKEQVRVETEKRIRVETALNLLALSKLSYEEISKYSAHNQRTTVKVKPKLNQIK